VGLQSGQWASFSEVFPPGSNFYYAIGLLSTQTSQSTINMIFLFPGA